MTNHSDASSLVARLHKRLVVSCQAYPGEPLRSPEAMLGMALSAERGGAAGIRAQGLDDIRLIAQHVRLPMIGLLKVGSEGVFITPTLEDAIAVVEAGADIVALDGTRRPRPDGRTLAETVVALRERVDTVVMADCGSLDDGLAAQDAGADIVGTTLAGYTGEREAGLGPDLDLIAELAPMLEVPLFAEGRIHTPEQARAALDAGAFSVVVGTAITHPATITSWFADAVDGA
jgi:N-acylglucosamine-6-phosphate 2-epimerase